VGFFSWDCKCGHPLLSNYVTNEVNGWMNQVVVLEPSGCLLKGDYDGYGKVGGREIDFDSQVFHHACWELAGRPTQYTEPSPGSADQGFFFDAGDHDMPEPKKLSGGGS